MSSTWIQSVTVCDSFQFYSYWGIKAGHYTQNVNIYVLSGYGLEIFVPSVLWRCWLGGRKVVKSCKKTEWWGTGMVICLERGADLHMAQLMPLPLTVSCFSKIKIGFTFLVPAHPVGPGQRAVKRVCVCVCVSGCGCARRIFLQGCKPSDHSSNVFLIREDNHSSVVEQRSWWYLCLILLLVFIRWQIRSEINYEKYKNILRTHGVHLCQCKRCR